MRRVLRRLHRARGRAGALRRPPEALVFEKTLAAARDYDDLIADISEAAPDIAALASHSYLRFEARLTLLHVDSAKLVEVCESLARFSFAPVDLNFGFPPLSGPQAARIKDQFRRFCEDPVAKHRSLRITGLPFCFLPAKDFPILYRALAYARELSGSIGRQRDELKKVEAASHRLLPACRACRRRQACYALSGIASHPEYAPHLEAGRERTVVFAGGSITPGDRSDFQRQDVVFTRPAEQGSFLMALLEGFRDVLLLDGYFFDRYSPTTFEVMMALERGVNVFGAASMGALRALELDRCGMRGSGYVYRFLKRHKIAPYHAVAQTYHDEDRPLTIPLVAVHYFLERAARAGIIAPADIGRLYAAADAIHFPRLTFGRFFRALEEGSDADAAARLAAYFDEQGAEAFDIKRKDALELLSAYRRSIRRDGAAHVSVAYARAKKRYAARLRAKFGKGGDCTLPRRWAEPLMPEAAKRERPIARTIELAERFCEDLDVVMADISRFDPADYRMINFVFAPFYFLGYFLSSASGYGRNLDDALVSGFMELIERIPMGLHEGRGIPRRRLTAPVVPARRLPLFNAVTLDRRREMGVVDGRGRPRESRFVECTEIVSGRDYALTSECIRRPSSTGLASGNTFLEAVVYGIYESIERDVTRTYETEALSSAWNRINLDSDLIQDRQVRSLIEHLRGKGERIAFFDCVNIYGLPMVQCAIHSPERKTTFTGFNCRLRRQDAMIRSFQEAMNIRYVLYSGTRDDKHMPEDDGTAFTADAYSRLLGRPLALPAETEAPVPLAKVLDLLLSRLRRNGIPRVFVLNLSPKPQFGLQCVKVIIPGLDFPGEEGGAASPALDAKNARTARIVRAAARRWGRKNP